MKLTPTDPPRRFRVGRLAPVELSDCGRIELAPDEQVTFTTEAGGEYDVARKSWGFYATPSLNGRLRSFGWRAALVKSQNARFYVLLVEAGKDAEFQRYLDLEGHVVVCWLDRDEDLEVIQRKVRQD